MSVALILGVGLVLLAALAVSVVLARRAGAGAVDQGSRYGRELEAPPAGAGRQWSADRRQRALIAIAAAATASIGAGMAAFLAAGGKH